MKHDFLDHHSHGHSLFHRLHPGAKLIMVLVYLLCVVTVPPGNYLVFIVFGVWLGIGLFFTRVPFLHILTKGIKLLPFVLILTIFIPFLKAGTPRHIGTIGGIPIRITLEGWWLFLNILSKSILAIFAVVFLNLTTPFHVLLKGLQSFGAPRIITDTLAIAYRYLFVITDEKDRMLVARQARSIRPTLSLVWGSLAQLIGVLFVRSYERGERMYQAMCSRGFQGTILTLDEHPLKTIDILWVGGISLAAMGMRWYIGS